MLKTYSCNTIAYLSLYKNLSATRRYFVLANNHFEISSLFLLAKIHFLTLKYTSFNILLIKLNKSLVTNITYYIHNNLYTSY